MILLLLFNLQVKLKCRLTHIFVLSAKRYTCNGAIIEYFLMKSKLFYMCVNSCCTCVYVCLLFLHSTWIQTVRCIVACGAGANVHCIEYTASRRPPRYASHSFRGLRSPHSSSCGRNSCHSLFANTHTHAHSYTVTLARHRWTRT